MKKAFVSSFPRRKKKEDEPLSWSPAVTTKPPEDEVPSCPRSAQDEPSERPPPNRQDDSRPSGKVIKQKHNKKDEEKDAPLSWSPAVTITSEEALSSADEGTLGDAPPPPPPPPPPPSSTRGRIRRLAGLHPTLGGPQQRRDQPAPQRFWNKVQLLWRPTAKKKETPETASPSQKRQRQTPEQSPTRVTHKNKDAAHNEEEKVADDDCVQETGRQSSTASYAAEEPNDNEVSSTVPTEPGAFRVDGPAPIYLPADEEQSITCWNHHDEESPFGPNAAAASISSNDGAEQALNAVVAVSPEQPRSTDGDDGDAKDPKDTRYRVMAILVALLFLIVVALVVIMAVMMTGGEDGNDGIDTSLPDDTLVPTTLAPTVVLREPTPAPVGPFDECFDSTKALATALQLRRNFDEFVDVELCPRQILPVDLTIDFEIPWRGRNPPVSAQSNVRVKCGPEGRLTDRCIVSGGEALVLNTWTFAREDVTRNVTFEGITFERGVHALIVMFSGGDITFKNCLFREFSEKSPIKIDFPGWDDMPDVRQRVTFESCIFENIQYGPTDVPAASEVDPDLAALIVATNSRNSVVVRDCVFRNNNVETGFSGSVIVSLGAEVVVEQSCFESHTASLSPVHFVSIDAEEEEEEEGDGTAAVVWMDDNYVGDASLWDCPGWLLWDFNGTTCMANRTDDTVVDVGCASSVRDVEIFW